MYCVFRECVCVHVHVFWSRLEQRHGKRKPSEVDVDVGVNDWQWNETGTTRCQQRRMRWRVFASLLNICLSLPRMRAKRFCFSALPMCVYVCVHVCVCVRAYQILTTDAQWKRHENVKCLIRPRPQSMVGPSWSPYLQLAPLSLTRCLFFSPPFRTCCAFCCYMLRRSLWQHYVNNNVAIAAVVVVVVWLVYFFLCAFWFCFFLIFAWVFLWRNLTTKLESHMHVYMCVCVCVHCEMYAYS